MERNIRNAGGLRDSRGPWRAGLAASISVALVAGGCAGGSGAAAPPAKPGDPHAAAWREEAKGVLAPSTGAAPRQEGQSPGDWQIVIAAFGGASAPGEAQGLAAQVRALGLAGAYAEERGKGWVVAYGRYPGLGSKQAREDLARIKELVVDGDRPFAAAILSPPDPRHIAGTIPEYDLTNVRREHGKDAAYTLQVAIYTRMDGRPPSAGDLAAFRRAAEEAVNRLRREGQEAYYYHTPRSSIVTVGVFTYKDVDSTRRLPNGEITSGAVKESIGITTAKERNPYNLVNGQAIRVRGQLQPSMLVQLP